MPIGEVQVSHVDSIPLAVVCRQVRRSELATAVPHGCGVVWNAVRAQRLPGGRNVAVYWDSTIRLEVGVESSGPIADGGEVVGSATPAGLAASVVHFGPYGQLGAAHQAILAWCAANGRALAGPSWEIYGHWQESWNADPSRIRTDVFYQLVPDDARPG